MKTRFPSSPFILLTLLALGVGLFSPAAAEAQVQLRTLDEMRRHLGDAFSVAPSPGQTGCVLRDIACGQTVNARLLDMDCATSDRFTFFDAFLFDGTAGDEVTINMTSNQLDPFLLLLDPNLDLAADDDDGGAGRNARIVFTLNQTGEWAISASGLPGLAETGNYTLSLECSGSNPPPPPPPPPGPEPLDPPAPMTGPCIAGPQTLCLSDDRFRVRANFRPENDEAGTAQVVELTQDTGYFWFFDAANVEMVVKVLNACSFADRFWVFAGGLTNVEVAMRVEDTQTGASHVYTNPASTPFQPIQDTNAFATCP